MSIDSCHAERAPLNRLTLRGYHMAVLKVGPLTHSGIGGRRRMSMQRRAIWGCLRYQFAGAVAGRDAAAGPIPARRKYSNAEGNGLSGPMMRPNARYICWPRRG